LAKRRDEKYLVDVLVAAGGTLQPAGGRKRYFDLAKPEHQDLTPIFKVVKEVLPQK
jgi:hypothetical protein